jgi:hypothetical protein
MCLAIWTPIYQNYNYVLINVENLVQTWTLKNACSSCIQALSWGRWYLSDTKKILAIVHMLTLKTPKDIHVFNDMAQYHKCFIKDFAFIMALITKLLWKIKTFEWTIEWQQAWEKIKQHYMDGPDLISPHWDIKCHVYTNASNLVVNVMLA